MKVEDTYGIDGSGKIKKIDDKKHYDENGNEVDKLLKGGTLKKYKKGKGIKGDGHINVEKGALGNISKDGINDKSQVLTVSSGAEAEKLFDFIAGATNNEFGKYDFVTGDGANKSVIHTTFDWDRIKNNTRFIEGELKQDPGLQLVSMIHSHGNNPDPNVPTVGTLKPSGVRGGLSGDRAQAKRLTNVFKEQPNPPRFFIWRYGARREYGGGN